MPALIPASVIAGRSGRLRRDLVPRPSVVPVRGAPGGAPRQAAAAAIRMPTAVGGEGRRGVPVARSAWADRRGPRDGDPFDGLAARRPTDDRRGPHAPLLIGGALTSAALSLAGAAFVAWRRTRPAAAMARRAMVRARARRRRGGIAAAGRASGDGWTDMPIKLPSFRPRRDAYPPDLWTKCPSCEEMLFNKQLDKVLRVCPDVRPPLPAVGRGAARAAPRPRLVRERDAGLQSVDPLGFVDQKTYPDRVAAAQLATGMRDAAVWGTARSTAGRSRSASWTSGSWAARWAPSSARRSPGRPSTPWPSGCRSSSSRRSGGARMQEGTLALMQLAKTVGALERLRAGGRPVHQRPDRPDDRRRLRLVRRPRRRQHRRAERADRLRRRPRLGRHDRPGAAGRASSARSSCSSTGSSTGSSIARSCAPRSPGCSATSSRSSADRRARTATSSRSGCRRSGRCRSCRTSRSGSCRARPRSAADERQRHGTSPTRRAGAGPAPARPPRRRSRRRRAPAPDRRAGPGGAGLADRRSRRRRKPDGARRAGPDRGAAAWLTGSAAANREARRRRGRSGRRRSTRRGLGPRPARPQPAPAADPRARRRDGRRLRRAPRRPVVRRRRGDRRRLRPDRRPAGRRHRPAEGRRHRREHPAQLRDAASGGLPQGDAGDGAGRAVRPAGRDVRRRPGRPSRCPNPRSAGSPRRSPARSG